MPEQRVHEPLLAPSDTSQPDAGATLHPALDKRLLEDAQAHIEQSELLKQQRDWQGALLALDRALSLNLASPAIYASRIELLCRLSRDDEAWSFLRQLPASITDSKPLIPARIDLLNRSGLHEEAQKLLGQAARETIITRQFDLPTLNQWLTACISSASGRQGLAEQLRQLASYQPSERRYQGLIASYGMLEAWLDDLGPELLKLADQHVDFERLTDIDADRAMRVFYRYLRLLAEAQLATPSLAAEPSGVLNVLGESHCLSPANVVFPWLGELKKARSRFVMGLQMHHLAQQGENAYKFRVLGHLRDIAEGPLLLTIGEIDCRPVEGMWRAAARASIALDSMAEATVQGYLAFLDLALSQRPWPSITLQGVPAPGYDLTGRRDPGDKAGFIAMICKINHLLRMGAQQRGWNFLDVHGATSLATGLGNGRWHVDRYHLAPLFYQQAMQWIN